MNINLKKLNTFNLFKMIVVSVLTTTTFIQTSFAYGLQNEVYRPINKSEMDSQPISGGPKVCLRVGGIPLINQDGTNKKCQCGNDSIPNIYSYHCENGNIYDGGESRLFDYLQMSHVFKDSESTHRNTPKFIKKSGYTYHLPSENETYNLSSGFAYKLCSATNGTAYTVVGSSGSSCFCSGLQYDYFNSHCSNNAILPSGADDYRLRSPWEQPRR